MHAIAILSIFGGIAVFIGILALIESIHEHYHSCLGTVKLSVFTGKSETYKNKIYVQISDKVSRSRGEEETKFFTYVTAPNYFERKLGITWEAKALKVYNKALVTCDKMNATIDERIERTTGLDARREKIVDALTKNNLQYLKMMRPKNLTEQK
jgi:arginyl-tRNA synthetase